MNRSETHAVLPPCRLVVRRAVAASLAGGCLAFAMATVPAAAAETPPEPCGAAQLTLSIAEIPAMAHTLLQITAVNRHASCLAHGMLTIEILKASTRAKLTNNPITVHAEGVVHHGAPVPIGAVQWTGWCGSRERIEIVARLGRITGRHSATYVPPCPATPQAPPRLVAV